MTKAKTRKIPEMKLHKATGQGYVRLNGKRIYLGKWNLPETRQRYERTIVEYLANGNKLRYSGNNITVAQLCCKYLEHAKSYYRGRDGKPSSEVKNAKTVIKLLVSLYGDTLANEFGPTKLKDIRKWQISQGHSRQYVNKMAARIRRIFKWGISDELIESAVLEGLKSVTGLRKGRSDAPESKKITPVGEDQVNAIKDYTSKPVWAMVQFQKYTGARSGEVVIMRAVDIDMSTDVWVYTPQFHKTDYKGFDRKIFIGPKAKEILRPFLVSHRRDQYLFSPSDAERQRRKEKSKNRKTPLSCGNKPGSNRKKSPQKQPGIRYTPDSYRRAIQYACKKAGIDKWHPHQLRHTAATYIREHFGLEAAQHVLGHKYADITQEYAEANYKKAIDAIAKVG